MKKIILITVLLIAGAFAVSRFNVFSKPGHFRYVITETGAPTSLDPLDGDQTQNLPVQRMIYATPVEVDSKGSLQSLVLESFQYNPENKTMTWTVKSGLKFSDGTEMTANDVAFAVTRMAFTRPEFPVIDKIEGIQNWVQTEGALEKMPSGIKVEENQITIRFTEAVDHPLFRFCLEIFSIIPKSCVDLKTNKVTCSKLPFSGHYELKNQTSAKIEFQMRDDSFLKGFAPQKIDFEYRLPGEVFNSDYKTVGITVIQGNEIKLSLNQLKTLKEHFQTSFLPSARIALHTLNPNTASFKTISCRLLYADNYRKAFSELATAGFKIESSVFTDVLPGYTTSEELLKSSSSEHRSDETCLKHLRENPPKWSKIKNEPDSIFALVAEKTSELLGLPKSEPHVFNTRKDEQEAFIKGKIDVLGASTGFWALDPAGDIQMLLTPNMHKVLQFVTNDEKVQALIKNLKTEDKNNPEAFKKLNQYIHDQGLFNVFAHVRRFYASDSLDHIAELPISITSPAPWQVFKVQ